MNPEGVEVDISLKMGRISIRTLYPLNPKKILEV